MIMMKSNLVTLIVIFQGLGGVDAFVTNTPITSRRTTVLEVEVAGSYVTSATPSKSLEAHPRIAEPMYFATAVVPDGGVAAKTSSTTTSVVDGVPGLTGSRSSSTTAVKEDVATFTFSRTVAPPQERETTTITTAAAMTPIWNPAQAAEFVIWHTTVGGGSPKDAGSMMASMVAGWTSDDLVAFMNRLYLSKPLQGTKTQQKLFYDAKWVREPQWYYGLSKRNPQGWDALYELLLPTALSNHLMDASSLAQIAGTFLVQPHVWRSDDPLQKAEQDTFANQGHAYGLGRTFAAVRRMRLGRDFDMDEVLDMLLVMTTTTSAVAAKPYSIQPWMVEFFQALDVIVKPSEKHHIRQTLEGTGQWSSTQIREILEVFEEIHFLS